MISFNSTCLSLFPVPSSAVQGDIASPRGRGTCTAHGYPSQGLHTRSLLCEWMTAETLRLPIFHPSNKNIYFFQYRNKHETTDNNDIDAWLCTRVQVPKEEDRGPGKGAAADRWAHSQQPPWWNGIRRRQASIPPWRNTYLTEEPVSTCHTPFGQGFGSTGEKPGPEKLFPVTIEFMEISLPFPMA